MKKFWRTILGRICYILGVFFALYVGGWLMLICPIKNLLDAFSTGTLTGPMLITNIIIIALSTTFAGLVWCIGYIGYNFFKGTEDPDWNELEAKISEKKAIMEEKLESTKENVREHRRDKSDS